MAHAFLPDIFVRPVCRGANPRHSQVRGRRSNTPNLENWGLNSEPNGPRKKTVEGDEKDTSGLEKKTSIIFHKVSFHFFGKL